MSEYEVADREKAFDGNQVSTTRTTSISICCTQGCITEQPPTRLGYRIGSRMLDGEGAISANYQHPLPRLLRGGQPTYTHIPPRCYASRILCLISSTYQSICSHALVYTSPGVTRSPPPPPCSDHDHEPGSQARRALEARRAQRG